MPKTRDSGVVNLNLCASSPWTRKSEQKSLNDGYKKLSDNTSHLKVFVLNVITIFRRVIGKTKRRLLSF